MILTTIFDLDAFASIFGVCIGAVNLIFVTIFALIEGKRIGKIEKHHDRANWYETFNLHDDTYSLVLSSDVFKQKMLVLIGSKQKKIANEAVVIKNNFVEELFKYKDKFLSIVEVIDKDRVEELTNHLNEIEDIAINLLNNVINAKNKEEAIASVNESASLIKKRIIEIGFKLSVF